MMTSRMRLPTLPPGWRAARARYRRDAAAIVVIGAVWLLFYWRVFTPLQADRVQFAPGDFTQQFGVFRNFAFQEFKAGRLPLWLPCVDSGYPYVADPQSASFYPPALLNIGLRIASGATDFPIEPLELEAALHVLLAGLLMYGFLRGEVRHRASALVGALVFAFGGFLTGYPILQLAILESAAWLPLALWGARRMATRGDWRGIAVTSISLALSVLAGHPQTYTYIFYAVAIYFVYLAWRERLAWRAALSRLGGAIGLAVALSAIQLLPSIEFAHLSTRSGLPYVEAGTGFPLADLIQFVVTGTTSQFNPLYVGLLPLALAAFALGLRKQRDVWFWLLLGVGGLVLSFGRSLAVFDAFYWFAPGYGVFRDQERQALIVTLAVSVLAAYGADGLMHSLTHRARGWLRSESRWLSIGLAVLFVMLLVVSYLHWQGIDPSNSGDLPDHVALAFVAGLGALVVLLLRLHAPARRLWIAVAMIGVVAFDLATADREVNWVAPYDPFPAQPSIAAIRSDVAPDMIFRIHNEQRLPGHILCVNGLDEVGGVTPIRVGAYAQFLSNVPREVRWQLLNVQYVVTWRSLLDDHLGNPVDAMLLDQQGTGKDAIYTYRLNEDHPRAWVVHQIEQWADRAAIYTALSDPGFDPRRMAYTSIPVQVAATGDDHVTVQSINPDQLDVNADLSASGLLVLSEVNYPGWTAQVNGAEMPIVEVDGLLRGVVLPAGSSHVEMIFRPMSLMVGSVVTSFGLLLWVGLSILAWRRKP